MGDHLSPELQEGDKYKARSDITKRNLFSEGLGDSGGVSDTLTGRGVARH